LQQVSVEKVKRGGDASKVSNIRVLCKPDFLDALWLVVVVDRSSGSEGKLRESS